MAQTPPFTISDETKTNEELRLKYRYLDLRRAPLQRNLIMRHKIAQAAREYYYANDFIEIETPMMMKSTPEGARDYLKILCPPAITANLQAAADGCWYGSLYPDCKMFP